MINYFVKLFHSFDIITYKILKYGLLFCLTLGIISASFLLTYNFLFSSPFLFDLGMFIFQIGFIFSVEFIICSVVIDKLKKDYI